MSDIRFTEDHEWVRIDDDGLATVGISNYAQDQLGDVVYVELPKVGRAFVVGEEMVVVESVKAAGEVKAPISGQVVELNEALSDSPEHVNVDPFGDGWLVRLKPEDPEEMDDLMSESSYQEYISGL